MYVYVCVCNLLPVLFNYIYFGEYCNVYRHVIEINGIFNNINMYSSNMDNNRKYSILFLSPLGETANIYNVNNKHI